MKRASSIMMSILLLASTLAVSFTTRNVEATGTVYIRADGSIDPPTAPIQHDNFITSLPPPTEWNKTYGGTDEDAARSVQQTSDGGYIVCGYTRSFDAEGYADAWLVKTDANGNMQWNKTYGGPWEDVAHFVQQTGDGGYIVCGYTCAFSEYPEDDRLSDFWLFKTDVNGNVQWNKTCGSELGWDKAYEVQQTSDGGYIVVGGTERIGWGAPNLWLVKTDASGNMQWDRWYGGENWDWAFSVKQTSDEGYIIAGGYTGENQMDAWLVKIDANVTMQWNKTYGGTGYDQAHRVVQTNDGGYAVVGAIYSSDVERGVDYWLIKTDVNGNMQWNKTYGSEYGAADWAVSFQQTNDGGYIIVGHVNGAKAWLVKTDVNGNMQWNKTYGGAENRAYSVQQTSDGGYIMAGEICSFDTGLSDFWLTKLGPPPVDIHDIGVTHCVPSKVVVGQGYSLNINVTAANQGDYAETFNVAIYANSTIIQTQTVILESSASTTINFTWNTTGFDKGNYTISAVADTVPGETDIADNTLSDGTVYVGIPGDTNADGVVDIYDLIIVASAYGSTPTDPNWNPNADINGDGTVDIYDLILVASHYGETIP